MKLLAPRPQKFHDFMKLLAPRPHQDHLHTEDPKLLSERIFKQENAVLLKGLQIRKIYLIRVASAQETARAWIP